MLILLIVADGLAGTDSIVDDDETNFNMLS